MLHILVSHFSAGYLKSEGVSQEIFGKIGGSLDLMSLQGWGTDVYLRLPKLASLIASFLVCVSLLNKTLI